MTKRKLLSPFITGIGLTILILWILSRSLGGIAHAQSSSGIIHVANSGSDDSSCGSESSPCQTIQYAVDLAQGGDQILIAAGLYTDVHLRNAITQVVYIDKNLTLRGGYTTTNWTTSDPINNPTTLDAEGQGRVIYIAAGINTTIEGLRITGGDGLSFGGGCRPGNAGGGVYGYGVTAVISNCQIYNNTGSSNTGANGGGVYLCASSGTLYNNYILSNTTSTVGGGEGGGVFVTHGSTINFVNNTIAGNIASVGSSGGGGGIAIVIYSNAMLDHNLIISNTANISSSGYGGGVYIYDSSTTMYGNQLIGNIGGSGNAGGGVGGGLNIQGSTNILDGNLIVRNMAATNPAVGGQGGGVWVQGCESITFINNIIADNQANSQGSGLWFGGQCGNATLIHNTIADNNGIGQGVYVADSTLFLTNTILSGHSSVGITVTVPYAEFPGSATIESTLWYSNGVNAGGSGTIITGTHNFYGDPRFVNPTASNYHLIAGSPAIDAGVAAGIVTDFDGQTRPMGNGYDIGADEWLPLPQVCFLPLVLR